MVARRKRASKLERYACRLLAVSFMFLVSMLLCYSQLQLQQQQQDSDGKTFFSVQHALQEFSFSEVLPKQAASQNAPKTTKPPNKKTRGRTSSSAARNISMKQLPHLSSRELATIDPLSISSDKDNAFRNTTTMSSRVPFSPKVAYLGVMVDAGRHYFPLEWLYHLIHWMYRLRYNLLHLRLTDDEAFRIRLDSYPALAYAGVMPLNDHAKESSTQNVSTDGIYTSQQLRDLVAFAKKLNITIIPEVSLPGHVGSWAGVPGFIPNCPDTICARGRGIFMNPPAKDDDKKTAARQRTILKEILQEVVSIFDHPPFLHLGSPGDIVQANLCWNEAFSDLPVNDTSYLNYDMEFNQYLQGILQEIRVSNQGQTQYMRWEATGRDELFTARGKELYVWKTMSTSHAPSIPVINATFLSNVPMNFDGIDIYQSVVNVASDPQTSGIVASTLEYHPDFWLKRNIVGRLLTIAMGAAAKGQEKGLAASQNYEKLYTVTCIKTLDINPRLCTLLGGPAATYRDYSEAYSVMMGNWRSRICTRLTESAGTTRTMKSRFNTMKWEKITSQSSSTFWSTFADPIEHQYSKISADGEQQQQAKRQNNLYSIKWSGVILDVVNSISTTNTTTGTTDQIQTILQDIISPLGFNMVQLRLIDNNGFAIKLLNYPREFAWYYAVGWKDIISVNSMSSKHVPLGSTYSEIVVLAEKLGISLIPEINLSTNAGGWIRGPFIAQCANVLCDTNSPHNTIANEIHDPFFIPFIYSILRELLTIFPGPFIHLGSDERKSSLKCYQEGGFRDPQFSLFERKLRMVLESLDLNVDGVIRWQNDENLEYSDRAGRITQYRSSRSFQVPKALHSETAILTVDLLEGSVYNVYNHTRQLLRLRPLGILGEIRVFDKTTWEVKDINLRLVAFSLALRQSDVEIAIQDFPAKVVSTCQELQFSHCEGNQSVNETQVFVESLEFRDAFCRAFTMSNPKKRVKEEFLLQQDWNLSSLR